MTENRMPLDKKMIVVNELLELGKTEQEIAAALEKLGVTGDECNCRTCPISNYLLSIKKHKYAGIDTDSEVMEILVDGQWGIFPLDEYPELNGIMDFVVSFDEKQYPNLIAQREAS